MNKKFKLFASITSLISAITLAVFGIYATYVRDVRVNGRVSFVANKVDATVLIKEDSAPTLQELALLEAGGGLGMGTFVFVTGENEQQAPQDQSLVLAPSLGDSSGNYVYRYTISVTNNGSSAMTAVFVVLEDTSNNPGIVREIDGDGVKEVASEQTTTMTVTYTIIPAQLDGKAILTTFGAEVNLSI